MTLPKWKGMTSMVEAGLEAPPQKTILDEFDEAVQRLYISQTMEAGLEAPQLPGLQLPTKEERVRAVLDWAESNPVGFAEDLRTKGRTLDTETILKGFGATPKDIDEILGISPQPVKYGVEDIPTLFQKALPFVASESNVDQVISHFQTRPDNLRQTLVSTGRNQDTEALVRTIYPQISDKGLEDYFKVPVPQKPVAGGLEPEWENVRTGETISESELRQRYPGGDPKGEWRLTRETALNWGNVFKVFGQALTKLPKQIGASILQAIQGEEGASVVNRDWADKWIKDAETDQAKFAQEVSEKYAETRLPIKLSDLAELPQSMAFSLTSMGAGLGVGVPIALAPVPGARVAAWVAGTAASGAVAYQMATYQIMQTYLEAKNDEMKTARGRGLTLQEEERLKAEFSQKAMEYGLWEAVPEALSNLAFAKILTMPLGKMVGKSIASKIIGKLGSLYGEEFLTETITQKGQSDIEVEAGLREGKITWVEAFKEIAPQTFLLTTILGGAGQIGVSSVNRIKQSLKKEAGDSAVYDAIKDNITPEVFAEVEAEAKVPEVIPEVAPEVIPAEAIKPGVTPPTEAVVAPEKVTPAPEVTIPYTRESRPINMGATQGFRLALERENVSFTTSNPTLTEIVAKLDEIDARLTAIPKRYYRKSEGLRAVRETILRQIDIQSGLTEKQLRQVLTQPIGAVAPIPKAEVGMPEAVIEEVEKPYVMPPKRLTALNKLAKEKAEFIDKQDIADVKAAYKEGDIARLEDIGIEIPELAGWTTETVTDLEAEAAKRFMASRPIRPEVPSPLLNIPEETTLPMPDEVRASEDRVVMPPPPPKEPPPSEPSPTHPPQPAPIEAGRITMPDLQAPQDVVDMYSRPDFWRRVANLPLVRKAVGLFNPAAVANNPAQQAIILRAALKDEGAQKAQAVMSHLWEIGTQERIWGKTDEMGLLTKEPFVGISVDDIRTNPSKFSAQMTSQQKEWIKRAEEIEKAKLNALKRNEIEINELSFEDGGEYAGRRVMGKFNDSGELIESGRIGVGGRVGAKQAFEKTRIFKEASDGIAAGYRYMNSDEALYYNTIGAYNKIADRQMAEWVLTKVDWRATGMPEVEKGSIPPSKPTLDTLWLDTSVTPHSWKQWNGQTWVEAAPITYKRAILVLQAEAAHLRLRKAQQLLAALNRAVRGERVPSNTINSIASVYADQADTLKTLIPELQKPSPETADTVQTLTAEAKALISEARLEYYQAVDKRARAREEAMRVKYEEASIAHPAFQGKIFTGAEAKEIADTLRRGLQPQFIEALGAVNKVNAIGRFFMLAGDASPMAIQLQFLSFYRPAVYAKAWGGFVRAFFDPQLQYRYYANNRDLINRHPTLILSGRGTEFTEFMGRGGLGKKLGVLAKPLVPFQKAFESTLDVAGIELAKSLDHRATTPEATLQIDQFINEFRGLTSSARIGVSSTQRQVETAMLLAPRYNRAIAGYLFDIVHGGVRGELARMSLAQGLAGISAMAVAISIALGEDDDEIWQHFDPRSNKFFTWDVMGVKIGLGGKVRSVLKTFGNILRTGEVGQPALNFLRGNLSPGASTGLDLLTGKNYIGEPTRDNVLDFTKTVGRNFMMIWTQNFLMEGGTLKDKAIIATAEFLGLRGYDISAKKELKIKDLEERLGEVVGKTLVLTKKKPDIYDTRNIFSDVKKLLQNIPPEDVLADKGFAGWGHLVVKIEQSEANSLPNIAFKDYNFDKVKGDTLDSYMSQWAERQRIIEAGERAEYTRVKVIEGKEERTVFKGLQALAAHKVDYPNAQRGNLSKRDRELLLEYNAAVDKKQFIEQHPEIKVNPRSAWLKANPRENAELALVGQADILTKETYNEFQKLLKELDIPDAAIPEMTLPPETSLDTHFAYKDMVADGKHGSWEAQLLLKKDAQKAKETKVQSYAEWTELKLSDTPIASLELKVKNRENFDKLDAFSDKDSPDYIADDKARAEAIKRFKADNPEFVDDTRHIEAIEKGTDEAPIDDKLVNAHVDYGKLIDQEGIGSSSAEAMLFRVDNPDYDKFRTDKAIWDKQTLEPVDQSRIPIWRIDVKYRKEDAEYNAIKNPLPAEQSRLRDEYMVAHPEYRMDNRRREAYDLSNSKTGEKFPATEVENYVSYYEIPTIKESKRQERFIVENTAFAQAMYRITGKDIWLTKPEDVPNVAYDDIYDEYKDLFDEMRDNSDSKSPYYIKDKTERDARDKQIFAQNPAFKENYYRRKGYGDLIPDNYVENYVTYNLMPVSGYARERFLAINRNYYTNVYMNKKYYPSGHDPIDFTKVPSERVENLYNQYNRLPTGNMRVNFRYNNPELDEWLLLTGKVSQLASEQLELTAEDRRKLENARSQEEIDRLLDEIREKLGR